MRLNKIFQAKTKEWFEKCAILMSTSEPWITLKRDYISSFNTIGNPEKELYVAVDNNNKLLGFVLIDMRGAFVGYIQSICVNPEDRGQGTGTSLLEFAQERIFRESPNVFIAVSSFNHRAKKLYESLGFEYVGTLKDYIVKGYDEILLRKTKGSIDEFNMDLICKKI